MSEGLHQQTLCMMAAWNHRIVIGDALNEFEVMCYEAMCREVETLCKLSRICTERSITKHEKEQEHAED